MELIELESQEILRQCLRMEPRRDVYKRHINLFNKFYEIPEKKIHKNGMENIIYMLEDVLIYSTMSFNDVIRSLKFNVIEKNFLEICKKLNLLTLFKQRMHNVMVHWYKIAKTQIFAHTNYSQYIEIMRLIV